MDFALLVEDTEAGAAAVGPPTSSASLLLSPNPRKGNSTNARGRMMAMRRRRRPFQAGDLAIVVERHDSFVPLYLTPGEKYMNRFGAFHHDDILGRPFGAKVRALLFGVDDTSAVRSGIGLIDWLTRLTDRHRIQIPQPPLPKPGDRPCLRLRGAAADQGEALPAVRARAGAEPGAVDGEPPPPHPNLSGLGPGHGRLHAGAPPG